MTTLCEQYLQKLCQLAATKVEALRDGAHFPFTVVLRDPLANSFIGPRRDAAAGRINQISEASAADARRAAREPR